MKKRKLSWLEIIILILAVYVFVIVPIYFFTVSNVISLEYAGIKFIFETAWLLAVTLICLSPLMKVKKYIENKKSFSNQELSRFYLEIVIALIMGVLLIVKVVEMVIDIPMVANRNWSVVEGKIDKVIKNNKLYGVCQTVTIQNKEICCILLPKFNTSDIYKIYYAPHSSIGVYVEKESNFISIQNIGIDSLRNIQEFTEIFSIGVGNYVEFENDGVRFAICMRDVMYVYSNEYRKESFGQGFELAFPCENPNDVDESFKKLISKEQLLFMNHKICLGIKEQHYSQTQMEIYMKFLQKLNNT